MSVDAMPETVARALALFPLTSPSGARVPRGLINHTYAITAVEGRFVLQRLNPIFSPEVNLNLRAVTEHLAQKGMATPRLVATRANAAWVDLGADGVFRLLSWVDGATFDVATSLTQLSSAAHLVGRFHRALSDLRYRFVALRAGVHDLSRHFATLADAVLAHPGHRLFTEVDQLARELRARKREVAPKRALVSCLGHGDLKLNNIRFAGESGPGSERALCLIDLDTVGPQALAFELGDAWRSWCNAVGEDPLGEGASVDVVLDLECFRVSLEGYREGLGRALDARESRDLLDGVEWVSLELAARFAADALNESYFGWDPDCHRGRGEHNLARARTQLALHRSARACRAQRETLLA